MILHRIRPGRRHRDKVLRRWAWRLLGFGMLSLFVLLFLYCLFHAQP